MNENLFSYGTLRKKAVQLKLFGRLLVGANDFLKGYKISPIEIKDKSFLEKGERKNQLTLIATGDDADVIEGIIFEISEKELLAADKYEPANYRRIKIALQSGKEAWIYVAAQTD